MATDRVNVLSERMSAASMQHDGDNVKQTDTSPVEQSHGKEVEHSHSKAVKQRDGTDVEQSRLLKLPRELRDRIYYFALCGEHVKTPPYACREKEQRGQVSPSM